MADAFATHVAPGLSSPASRHEVIVPNDSADLPNRPRAIKCLSGGNVTIRDEAGTDVTYSVVAGEVLQLRAVRVMETGTTVTPGTLIAWW